MRKVSKVLTAAALATLTTACASSGSTYGRVFGYSYPLPLMTLKGKNICGEKVCDPGSNGRELHYTDQAYWPEVEQKSTAKDIALQLVGRTFAQADNRGGRPFSCSTGSNPSPFTTDNISVRGNVDGIATKYKREAKLEFDVGAKVEADLEALKLMGIEQKLSLDAARAKLSAAYNQVSGSTIEFGGRYYVYGLKDGAYEGLFKNGAFPDCEKVLRNTANAREIVTDVGLVVFDGELKSTSASKVVSDLEAEFKTYGIPFDVTASVERTVEDQLHATLKTGFAVISVRRAGLEEFYPHDGAQAGAAANK